MRRILLLCALLMAATGLAAPAQASAARHLYVATWGDDRAPGSASRPFRTLQRAKAAVRALNDDQRGDLVVHVRRGDYELAGGLDFTAEDSGGNGHRVVYQVWGGPPGSARLIGGHKVTGWSRYRGEIFRAPVSERFDTLYEGAERAVKARTPNHAPSPFATAKAGYFVAEPGEVGNTVLKYRDGDLDPTGWDLTDAQVYLWPRANWFAEHNPIAAIDPATRTITLKNQTRYPMGVANYNSRFYVQGMLSMLDQPGEFHYSTTEKMLYYWPRESLREVIVPTTKSLLRLSGAHHLTFDGLGFEATDFSASYRHGMLAAGDSGETHQYPIYDRQINRVVDRIGMIFMTGTHDVTISRSHLRNSGHSAIYMLFANTRNRIESNWIERTGHTGVFLEGNYPAEGDTLTGNVLTNNLIHDVGELLGHGAGYCLMQASGNEISYSEIYNSPRFGTYIAGYRELPNETLYARDNVVKYLNIHDVMQDSRDGGAVYTFGMSTAPDGPFQTNTYDQIVVNQSANHPEANNSQSGASTNPAAVYLDEGTYGQPVSNVDAANIQRTPPFKTNKSAGVVTNSSWLPGFDPSKVHYGQIGLRADFPYKTRHIAAGSTSDRQFIHGTKSTFADAAAPPYRVGAFSYRLPVANGHHTVRLRFTEPAHTEAGKRVFSVTAEGRTVIQDLDVYRESGGKNRPLERRFTVRVTDGRLDLAFLPTTDQAVLTSITLH
ncbi:malectin domain-containing carbohydrate-binding protein [Nonomuraea sp. NPDC050790]|uniref:malectin domain-containing carbohydrate-binding protein n=1 Tax=Nonomuraea sp. NPDC050790 TaxID=3364371 RepID=UPI0037B65D95